MKIVARQKFALPLFWQAVNLDLFPALKNVLVVQAYTNYFRGTVRNFQAQYKGHPQRVGRPWETGESEGPSAVESLLALLGLQPADLEKLAGGFRGSRPVPATAAAEPQTDAHGFRHFPGGASLPEAPGGLWTEGRGFLAGFAEIAE